MQPESGHAAGAWLKPPKLRSNLVVVGLVITISTAFHAFLAHSNHCDSAINVFESQIEQASIE